MSDARFSDECAPVDEGPLPDQVHVLPDGSQLFFRAWKPLTSAQREMVVQSLQDTFEHLRAQAGGPFELVVQVNTERD